MFQIIIGLAITYGICYALDRTAHYCDFTLPQIQEKRYKKQVIEKFGPGQPEDLPIKIPYILSIICTNIVT